MAVEKDKILVVDDDAYVCRSLAEVLQEEGYTVVTAQDGPTAPRLLYAERPDLVILDVMMPDMDGWEVCRRIRELTDIPVLMLTARGQVKDRVKGLDLEADDYLVKPVTLEELRARCGQRCGGHALPLSRPRKFSPLMGDTWS